MKLDEVPSVLDVHPPHETPHGWRDFLLHLTTITIGLLIALSLEGIVEWQHHRHLVHDAEVSLHAEIKDNASGVSSTLAALHKEQANLSKDVQILKAVAATGRFPAEHHMEVGYKIAPLASVSWKTAQSTGALSYMPYDLAQEYSAIYMQQDLLVNSETQAARDAILAIGIFLNEPGNDIPPSAEEAKDTIQKIEALQGQLMLVDSLMQALQDGYKAFLSEHPN